MTSNEKIYTEKECLICYNLNQEDTEILNSIAENIKIKMHLTGEISELISVPHFCIIADLSGLDKDTLIDFKSFLHKDLILKRIILINYLPETICDLNFHRENFYKDIDINQKNLKLNLLNLKTSAKLKKLGPRDHDYDKRIFRMLAILKLLKAKDHVDITRLTDYFNVTLRTLQRDIKLLRQIGESIVYDSRKKAYYLPDGKSILLD